jgi:exopolyphosphatase / guanosine-5'-triphosphate,3'-diphosphate pyrophosphatase
VTVGERIAVVDIGTNSTRLLVANVVGGRVEELERRTEITRLGDRVDSAGKLSAASMKRVFAAVESYRPVIDKHGAEKVIGVATSAVRDAKNGDRFIKDLAERYGIETRTISGDEEARLSFLGATLDRPQGGDPLLVIDIGGGSTEFVLGIPGSDPTFHVSTSAGSVRQTERHLTDDPPTDDQLSAVAGEVAAIIEAELPREVRREAAAGIAVAGTATQLAAVDQRLEEYDPERVHGYRLDRYAVEEILEHLASLPLAERRQIVGLNPARAPTIVAGALILAEAMQAFDFDWVETSEADILDGAALDAAGP